MSLRFAMVTGVGLAAFTGVLTSSALRSPSSNSPSSSPDSHPQTTVNPWQPVDAAQMAAAAEPWIWLESELASPDGVGHRCKASVGPVLTTAAGVSVRPVALFSTFLHSSGDYAGRLESAGLVAAQGNQAVDYGVGPLSGQSPSGVAWTGSGMKKVRLAPLPGKTWATVLNKDDLQLTVSVQ